MLLCFFSFWCCCLFCFISDVMSCFLFLILCRFSSFWRCFFFSLYFSCYFFFFSIISHVVLRFFYFWCHFRFFLFISRCCMVVPFCDRPHGRWILPTLSKSRRRAPGSSPRGRRSAAKASYSSGSSIVFPLYLFVAESAAGGVAHTYIAVRYLTCIYFTDRYRDRLIRQGTPRGLHT